MYRELFSGLLDDDLPRPSLIEPNLYLGDWKDATEMEKLKGLGITHILNLIPPTGNDSLNKEAEANFVFKNIPLRDTEDFQIGWFFEEAFTFMDSAINEKKGILVHCAAGVSRSAAIVTAYDCATAQAAPHL